MTRGIAAQKRAARIDLNQLSYSIISSARSWCIKNSNFELASKFELTPAEIKKMPYKLYTPYIGECITLIGPLVPQLAAFNITPESFQLLKEKYQTLKEINPGKAIKDRKALGKVIKQDVKSAKEFIDNQITPLMGNFQNAPEFFLGFYANKRIGLPDVHHTRLQAHVVTDLGDVYAATVRVDAYTDPVTNKHYEAVSSVTDPTGKCEISGFFPAFRTVTVSGQNIETKTFPAVLFQKAKVVVQTYTVTPAFTNIPAPQQTQQNQNA
jgi:hypothetical protein